MVQYVTIDNYRYCTLASACYLPIGAAIYRHPIPIRVANPTKAFKPKILYIFIKSVVIF